MLRISTFILLAVLLASCGHVSKGGTLHIVPSAGGVGQGVQVRSPGSGIRLRLAPASERHVLAWAGDVAQWRIKLRSAVLTPVSAGAPAGELTIEIGPSVKELTVLALPPSRPDWPESLYSISIQALDRAGHEVNAQAAPDGFTLVRSDILVPGYGLIDLGSLPVPLKANFVPTVHSGSTDKHDDKPHHDDKHIDKPKHDKEDDAKHPDDQHKPTEPSPSVEDVEVPPTSDAPPEPEAEEGAEIEQPQESASPTS